MNNKILTEQQKIIERETDKTVLAEQLLSDFYFFVRYTHYLRYNSEWQHSWYHPLVCEAIMDVYEGKTQNLCINIPPSTGKSDIVSVKFPAYCFINDPSCRFNHTSYSDTLVSRNSNDIKSILTSNGSFEAMVSRDYAFYSKAQMDSILRHKIDSKYIGSDSNVENLISKYPTISEMFPDFQIDRKKDAAGYWKTTQHGHFYAVSAGGQITGFHAGRKDEYNILTDQFRFRGCYLVDDPHDPQAVESDARRNTILEWYTRKFITRKSTIRTPQIIVMQRLHEQDLCGYIIENDDEKKWEVLSIPSELRRKEVWYMASKIKKKDLVDFKDDIAFAVDNPSFADEKISINPSLYSMSQLQHLKKLDPYMYAGQMMQRPAPEEGGIFKKEMIKTYKMLPMNIFMHKCLFIDTAHGTKDNNDRTSYLVMYQAANRIYVVDGFADRLEEPDAIKKMYEMHEKHRFNAIFVENKSIGSALVQRARRERLLPVFGFEPAPYGNKKDRAKSASLFLADYVSFPEKIASGEEWLDELYSEMLNFPNASHDDYVDALDMGILTLVNSKKIFYAYDENRHNVEFPYMPSNKIISYSCFNGTTVCIVAEVTQHGQIRIISENLNIDENISSEHFVKSCVMNDRLMSRHKQHLSQTILLIDNHKQQNQQRNKFAQDLRGEELSEIIARHYNDYPVRYVKPEKEILFESCRLINEQLIGNMFVNETQSFEPLMLFDPHYINLTRMGLQGGFSLKQKTNIRDMRSWELEEISPYYQLCFSLIAIVNYCTQNFGRINNQNTYAAYQKPYFQPVSSDTNDIQIISDNHLHDDGSNMYNYEII